MSRCHSKCKNILGSFFGSVSEWYEFVVYAFCAPFLAPLFFPSTSQAASVIAAFGAFAVGFFMRPLGAIVFGYFGDKYGRQKVLPVAVILIGLPTFIMGIMPTYETIGVLAPIILIIVRMLQGLSVGGQFTGSAIFISEHIGSNKRYFGSGITFCGAFIGMVLASLVGSVLTMILTEQQLNLWGWRIPFLLGIIVTLVGYYIKSNTSETPAFTQLKKNNQLSKNPIIDSFKSQKLSMVYCILICWLTPLIVYQLFIFMPTFAHKFLDFPLTYALQVNTVSMITLAGCTVISGLLADRIGYFKVMGISALALIIFTPIMYIIMAHSVITYLFVQLFFSVIASGFMGPVMGVLCHLFDVKVRYTAVSISYNIGFGIFGGTAALLSIYLVESTGIKFLPGIYISAAGIISLITLIIAKRKVQTT